MMIVMHRFFSRYSRYFSGILMLLCSAVLVVALWQLGLHIYSFLQGAYHGDATYYWAEGRALLNGLTFYEETFENRAPGVIILSALSLFLFGNGALGFWINALVVVLIPLLLFFCIWQQVKELERTEKRSVLLLTLFFGIFLSLFVALLAGGWQIELYGSLFGFLFLLGISLQRQPLWQRMAIIIIGLFGAVGFKEPFFLVLLASALLLLPSPRQLVRLFVVPSIIVAFLGVSALIAGGILKGYFGIYLPSIFGYHMMRVSPFWERGLQVEEMLGALWSISPFFLAVLLAMFLAPLFSYRSTPRLKVLHGCWLLLLVAGLFLLRFLGKATLSEYLPDASAIGLIIIVLGGIGFLWFTLREMREPLLRTVIALLALYLTHTAIGIRGIYLPTHFAVATPFFAAIFINYVQSVQNSDRVWRRWELPTLLLFMVLTYLAFSLQYGYGDLEQKMAKQNVQENTQREVASAVDAILDQCDVDQYYVFGERGFIGFTRHTPLNFYPYPGTLSWSKAINTQSPGVRTRSRCPAPFRVSSRAALRLSRGNVHAPSPPPQATLCCFGETP